MSSKLENKSSKEMIKYCTNVIESACNKITICLVILWLSSHAT